MTFGILSNRLSDTTSGIVGHLEFYQWHMDFLCHKENTSYLNPKGGRFPYACSKVDVYIYTTGVNFQQATFEGRALPLPGYISNLHPSEMPTENNSDSNGEGTACASLVSGFFCGIAKKSTLFAAKVLTEEGLLLESDLERAVDLTISNISLRGRPSLVVFPYYGCPTQLQPKVAAIDNRTETALKKLIDLNIPVFVPSGDGILDNAWNKVSSINSIAVTPARMKGVFTVGSLDRNGIIPKSCYGEKVSFYSPGKNLIAANYQGTKISVSGSKYACSLAAGICAQFLHRNPKGGASGFRDFYQKVFRKNSLVDYPAAQVKEDVNLRESPEFPFGIRLMYGNLQPYDYFEDRNTTNYTAFSFFVKGELSFFNDSNLGSVERGKNLGISIIASSVDVYSKRRPIIYKLASPLPGGLRLGPKSGRIYGSIKRSQALGNFEFTVRITDGTYTEQKKFFFEIIDNTVLSSISGKVMVSKKDYEFLGIDLIPNLNCSLSIKRFNKPISVKFPESKEVVVLNKDTGIMETSVFSDKRTGEFFCEVKPGNYQLVLKSDDNEKSKVVDKIIL